MDINFHEVPRHNIVHTIDTGQNAPCRAKPRALMPGSPKYESGRKATLELEKLGVLKRIGPAETTQWSSALHLVTKADGSQRVVGDYRGLNDRTLLDVYPLPHLNQFASRLRGANIFSTVDLYKSYHQIPLDLASQNKTTVHSPYGKFKFTRLAMGLKNSAQSFQKMLDFVLNGLDNVFCYLDDILVYNSNEIEHKKPLTAYLRG